jgi:hypothetical protein
MPKTTNKVTIAGKAYNLDEIADLAKIKVQLVPEDWPGSASSCVRVFISLQEMLSFQLKRHLAYNWKKICHTAHEEANDGNPARVKLSFTFEVDQSAPTVAAIAAHALSFGVQHKTKGKPMTHDTAQGDFFEDFGDALDTEAFGKEISGEDDEKKEDDQPETPPLPGEELASAAGAEAPDVAPIPAPVPPKRGRGRPRKAK